MGAYRKAVCPGGDGAVLKTVGCKRLAGSNPVYGVCSKNRALMCGGMGKRYEMSIAKCNTEKVFLRDIMRK